MKDFFSCLGTAIMVLGLMFGLYIAQEIVFSILRFFLSFPWYVYVIGIIAFFVYMSKKNK